MGLQRYVLVGAAVAAMPLSVLIAPSASADCTNAGTATVCAQGEVRGGGPTAPVAGPVYPSYCADPWYCDMGIGWDIDVIAPPRPDRPDRPDRPGRPGRPGGGGGGVIGPR
jgi:hypothetical protein